MDAKIKLTRRLHESILADLEHPHPFAFERIGVISCRQSLEGGFPLLLCHDYHPIPDEHYLPDRSCGARIGEAAIHSAMDRALGSGSAQIWVHTHGRNWPTSPSRLDREEGPRMMRCLTNVDPSLCHGWIVISETEVSGQISVPGRGPVNLARLAVIGWPMVIPLGPGCGDEHTEHHARQGFLGSSAPAVIGRCKAGIVGLGGGGSHVNQQLAHLGVKNVVYADADRIEKSNLNRLVGATRRDVEEARLKSAIAREVFRAVQPEARIDARPMRWEDKTAALSDCDFVFGCLDGIAGRRDLEQFCRSRMIPLIDIGMVVSQASGGRFEIFGQAVASMPESHCLRCLGVVTEENLAEEAGDYGAGPQPQVVWPNGILASAAVGYAVHLLAGWSATSPPPVRLELKGGEQTLKASALLKTLNTIDCAHFSINDLGDPRLLPV